MRATSNKLHQSKCNVQKKKQKKNKQKTKKKKKKTKKKNTKTKKPPKTCSCFVWIYCRMHRFQSLYFYFQEKRIWLSSMANTVTQEAKPLRCEQKTHHKTDRSAGVTSNHKNGLVKPVYGFSLPSFEGRGRGGEGKRGEGRKEKWGGREDGEGDQNWGKNGREGKFARTKLSPLREGIRETRGWGGGKVAGGGEACPSPYFLQQMCYIITKKNIV